MINQYNPFKENRTEQMKDLWKYYVPFPGLDETGKPVVVEGGRGSGKTMFFLCNSWRQIISQLRKSGKSVDVFFDETPFVGIYYRVDTTFVSSMKDRQDDNWSAIFETYFSICILQEILDFIITLNDEMKLNDLEIINFVTNFSKKINVNSNVDNLRALKNETGNYLDIIENKINGTVEQNIIEIRWVKAHRFISDVCNACNKLLNREILFKVFIDEYETLQTYQQKIVNTLIKHSTIPLIFNIGLRPKGMKTNETISETETIESPHDYEPLTLCINSDKYQEILKKICQKRIALGKEKGKIPQNASEDIEYYLGFYSIERELELILKKNKMCAHIDKLRNIIKVYAEDENISAEEVSNYIRILCDDAPIINSRLHYALLCKKTTYTPKINELMKAYTSNSKRYVDWMHNRKFGLVFLLAREAQKEKMYYGFDVFAALSSNIVRYFLELCEQSFRIAFLDDYNWNIPISEDIQSEATKYVSEYKVLDIAGYEPYGKELRIFIQYLGQIFFRLHTDSESTLGEPEPNHFSTKDLSLSEKLNELLAAAVMCNVLQEGEPTKRKQSKLSPETVDYYINKIFVPYFGISYRNQRKIQLDAELLEMMLSGNDDNAKRAFHRYFKNSKNELVEPVTIIKQMSLFDIN